MALSFVHTIDNKADPIKLGASFFRSQGAKNHRTVPLIFIDRDETWKITKENATSLVKCNHKEADTRLVLHACLEDTNFVIVTKDMDIPVLMVYAYCIEKRNCK